MNSKEFADLYLRYLNKEEILYLPSPTANLLFCHGVFSSLPDDNPIKKKYMDGVIRSYGKAKKQYTPTFKGLNLKSEQRDKLTFTLSDFEWIISLAKGDLWLKLNTEVINKRKKTVTRIRSLLKCDYITNDCRSMLETHLDVLTGYDKKTIILTEERSLNLLIAWLRERFQEEQGMVKDGEHSIDDYLLYPMKRKKGGQQLFYIKSLTCVLDNILCHNSTAIATLLSGFLKRQVTPKNVENWLALSLKPS